jgi:hypothetical protein
MSGNWLAYDDYVKFSSTTSPLEAGDDVATRGATWSFLRYLADLSPTDGALWYNLVNSGQSGSTNLANRLGVGEAGLRGMLRDFVISVYVDDFITGVPAKYKQPSWNMRSKYPALSAIYQDDFPWPLKATALVDGAAPETASIQAGGFLIFHYRGMAGADSYISVKGTSGSTLPSGITVSVVRRQ